MQSINQSQQEIINNFNMFDNWLDKYQFLIDLGSNLQAFPEQYKQDKFKIKGCQSNVWMYHKVEADNNITLHATSDSVIVNGLIYLLLTIYSNRTCTEILSSKPNFITEIGLDKHLSPTRKNGLNAMLLAIMNIALVECNSQ